MVLIKKQKAMEDSIDVLEQHLSYLRSTRYSTTKCGTHGAKISTTNEKLMRRKRSEEDSIDISDQWLSYLLGTRYGTTGSDRIESTPSTTSTTTASTTAKSIEKVTEEENGSLYYLQQIYNSRLRDYPKKSCYMNETGPSKLSISLM